MTSEPALPISEIDPAEAARAQAAGALLLDVREPGEWALGSPDGALRIALAALPAAIDRAPLHDHVQQIAVLCASGRRSLLAAAQLRAAGFAQVASVAGGFQRWQQLGLPWSAVSTLDVQARERYSRHLLLPEVGEAGQQRLQRACVLVVGAGGLGSPVALYLAAAGVGYLRIMDPDVVERSNLQRQILHADARVGQSKAESAASSLRALNPSVVVDARAQRVDAHNVRELVGDVDVVIDGSDNFTARYLLDAACTDAGKPLVYGAIHRFEGQVSVFGGGPEAPCYRCLFPDPPADQDAPNCAEAGVLGVLPGIIGSLQAAEALKLVLGIGRSLQGRLLHVDALTMQFRELRIVRDPHCPGCGPAQDRRLPQGLEVQCRVR